MVRACGWLIGSWWLLGAGALAAQEPAPASVAEELARLNRTLQQLVAVAQQQLGGQRIELLMRQVEIKRAKVAPLEQALRAAREARDNAEEQLRSLQLSREQVLESVALSFEAAPEATGLGTEDRERMEETVAQMVRQHDQELKMLRERIASAEERIQVLENDLAPAKAELQHWEAQVDRELSGR